MTQKLGPHIQRSTDNALRFASVAPCAKAIDNTQALRVARPGAITIFRHFTPYQDFSRSGADVAREIIGYLGDFRPTYCEVYNETKQKVGDGLERHVSFMEEAGPVFRAAGIRLAGFCFSNGNPEPSDWEYLRSRRYGGVDAVGIHEYWGNQGFSTWMALRYRRVHEWTQGDHPPFLITECGRDRVEGGGFGWKDSGITAEQYAQELLAYDAELAKDSYVLGATAFTNGPESDWVTFDVDPIVPLLVGTVPVPPPPPPPGAKYAYRVQAVSSQPTAAGLAVRAAAVGSVTIRQGSRQAAWVRLENTGTEVWRRSGQTPVRLGTSGPRNRPSAFHEGNRIALPDEEVSPGALVEFSFDLAAPLNLAPGRYRETYELVADGYGWIPGDPIAWDVTVLRIDEPLPQPEPQGSSRLARIALAVGVVGAVAYAAASSQKGD